MPADEKDNVRYRVRLAESLTTIEESPSKTTKQEDSLATQAEHWKLDLANRVEKKEKRKKWDKILSRLVVVGFVYSCILTIAIGFGWMTFSNQYSVPAILTGSFAQTYGLAHLAVNYFFSDDKSNSQT